MMCPKHHVEMSISLEVTGGCMGGHGEDDYCYCDPPDVHLELSCPGSGGFPRTRENRAHMISIVPGLTDRYGMERWFRDHLTTVCLITGEVT